MKSILENMTIDEKVEILLELMNDDKVLNEYYKRRLQEQEEESIKKYGIPNHNREIDFGPAQGKEISW